MYNRIKQAIDPMQDHWSNAEQDSPSEVIQRWGHQECLMEHNSELYTRENVVNEAALNAIEYLPTLE